MTDKPTPKEIENLFVEETGFDIDDFPAAILDFALAVLAKWGQPAQAAEPVAWLRNTTDPQPHAVTNLKYRSAMDAKAGVEYTPVFAAPQPIQAQADGFFLLLPQRPKPEAPAGTAGLDWDAYSGAQMLAFGRDCSDAAIAALRTEQPAPATQQAREVSDAMVLAALQMQHPAAYGQYLRHPANGPKTSIRTEAEIDTARRMIAAALAAGQATAAQAVVQDDLITLRKPTTRAEMLWLLKLAHLVISDVDKTLEKTFAPAQPAAQREMLKHALWLASSFTVHRYLMSNAEGRWSGAEKATCHDGLCCLYVAVFRGVEVDRVRVDLDADWVAVHDATQELTDHMDVVIGFPLKGVPDYEALAPKFFAYFHRLAAHTLRASHGQAPAGAAQADSVPAVSDLPPLPAPDLRDVGTKPQEIKEFLKGYATEYARTAIAARAQAGAVPLDEARRLFDAGWKAAAMLCDREDVAADGIIGFGACPQFESAFSAAQPVAREPLTPEQIQDLLLCGDPTDEEMRLIRIGWDAANGIKGGQHGTE